MGNTFVIADLHIGHEATWATFKKKDGSPLRPFTSTEEMETTLRDNWNKTVGPKDKVYVLGDLAMRGPATDWYKTVNGDKVLVKGNHDQMKLHRYIEIGFRDVRACHIHDKFILTHIPIHPQSLERWRANVHGHLHYNEITDETGNPDPKYLCVSVEQPWVNFTPLAWEDAVLQMRARGHDWK